MSSLHDDQAQLSYNVNTCSDKKKNPKRLMSPVSALSPPSFLLEDLTLSNSHLQVHVMIYQSYAR